MLVPAKSVTIIALRRGLDRADEKRLWNQTGCKSHHVCVHELCLRVTGKAPDALEWTLDGEPFTGM